MLVANQISLALRCESSSVSNLLHSSILLLQRYPTLASSSFSGNIMGSFGMDWNHKGAVLWDWGNSSPIGINANENPKILPQAEPELAGFKTTGHVPVHSSSSTFSASSEMGYCSSKSSTASIGSSPKMEDNMKLNFAPVKMPDKNSGKKDDLAKVDEARSSPSSVVAISSGEPVIGLKLGKRTYFEDGCGGQSVKSSPSDTTAVTPALAKKAKAAQNAQNSYCQVEGCKVDLSSAKDYHRKHKVCEAHSKSPKVVVAGLERRFCQQCSRFHALSEFDHKKRSCRRRLNDHNARRRKPPSEAIPFSASRLSAMFYDTRQQKSFLFRQGPYDQTRSCASPSWDNPGGGFKFAETKAPWLKSVGADGIHLSSQQVWNNIAPNGHHVFDGFIPIKGTRAKVFNQGVEASAVVSNLNGTPDLQRALSLLSNNSADAASDQTIRQLHPGLATIASSSNPVVQGSSAGLWQDGTVLDHQARFQAFEPPSSGNAPHQLHLTPLAYDSSPSHYDQMN